MTKTSKATIKNHIEAGLDITTPVEWVGFETNAKPVTANVTREGRYTEVRDLDGKVLQSGGAGAKFSFVY